MIGSRHKCERCEGRGSFPGGPCADCNGRGWNGVPEPRPRFLQSDGDFMARIVAKRAAETPFAVDPRMDEVKWQELSPIGEKTPARAMDLSNLGGTEPKSAAAIGLRPNLKRIIEASKHSSVFSGSMTDAIEQERLRANAEQARREGDEQRRQDYLRRSTVTPEDRELGKHLAQAYLLGMETNLPEALRKQRPTLMTINEARVAVGLPALDTSVKIKMPRHIAEGAARTALGQSTNPPTDTKSISNIEGDTRGEVGWMTKLSKALFGTE